MSFWCKAGCSKSTPVLRRGLFLTPRCSCKSAYFRRADERTRTAPLLITSELLHHRGRRVARLQVLANSNRPTPCSLTLARKLRAARFAIWVLRECPPGSGHAALAPHHAGLGGAKVGFLGGRGSSVRAPAHFGPFSAVPGFDVAAAFDIHITMTRGTRNGRRADGRATLSLRTG